MDQEQILYTPPDISKKDIKNIDKTLDTIYELLYDLIDKDMTGKDLDAALGRAHITVNKNAVPNDPQSPFVTSGIRIGTPSITTRGFKQEEASKVAELICAIIDNPGEEKVIDRVRGEVSSLCERFPMYEQ